MAVLPSYSYVRRRTMPTQRTAQRISVAFDMLPRR